MSCRIGVRAGWLAAAVLLAGCVPARWPARQEAPHLPPPPPPVASSPRPTVATPVPAPSPGPQTGAVPELPSTKAVPRAGNPPYYDVLGERYFVMPSSSGYREQGVASWYGAPFHGRRTSSGAIYDMHELTAAHKTLPLPSLARVTNLETGRSVVVTVNDRGPFVKDRLIDVSYAAAKQLGIVQSGTGSVEVEALGSYSLSSHSSVRPQAAAPTVVPVQHVFMQLGAFSNEANAARLKSNLESNGVTNVVIRYDDNVSPALYRVRIGPIEGSTEYDALASRVASLRIANPQLVTESPTLGGSPPTP